MRSTLASFAATWLGILVFVWVTAGCGDDPPPTGFAETRYPIVLAHGALGMESYGPLDYWYGIVEALEAEGAEVYVTQVSAINSSLERGQQLEAQVAAIVASSGASKVNLIGHSQGGLDARYVAGVSPGLVASVTTIGSPHQGAELAQVLADGILADGTFTAALIDLLGGAVEAVLELVTGQENPVDARAALIGLSPAGVGLFNALFPDGLPSGCGPGPAVVGGIHYFSWTGASVLTNVLDPTDGFLGLTSFVYLGEANDGLVSVCSAQFGDVIRDDYVANHLDEVNQILGIASLFETDPVTLFLNHANRLKNLGL